MTSITSLDGCVSIIIQWNTDFVQWYKQPCSWGTPKISLTPKHPICGTAITKTRILVQIKKDIAGVSSLPSNTSIDYSTHYHFSNEVMYPALNICCLYLTDILQYLRFSVSVIKMAFALELNFITKSNKNNKFSKLCFVISALINRWIMNNLAQSRRISRF